MLPFTRDQLTEAILTGRVTERKHPTLPLYIYNYSPEVQYTNHWDDITLNCRGLILDEDFNIVARPWRKFFNLGQVNLPIQFDDPVEVMDKADGSLGILYPTGPKDDAYVPGVESYAIATRGSFASEQAIHATEVWDEKYGFRERMLSDIRFSGMTYLFEIIYPQNRIVLDYKDQDDLILLGAVQKSTGYYYGPREAAAFIDWPGPVVEVMPYKSISEALAFTNRPNAEGFVIRSHNFMVKLKQPDYLELHRLVTNASPKTVWEQLKQGKSKSEIVSAFPDEFHDYISGMIDPLIQAQHDRLYEILEGYQKATLEAFDAHEGGFDEAIPRKTYAKAFSKYADKKYFFLLLDNQSIGDVLWSELKPRETAIERMDNANADDSARD
jgi:RNA ligase